MKQLKRLTEMATNCAMLVHFLFFLANPRLETAASDLLNQRPVYEASVVDKPFDYHTDMSALAATDQDMVAIHMLKLYNKYNRDVNRPRDGNTVRSFKASMEIIDQQPLYHFNLTSIQESEVILAATFHFFFDKRTRHRPFFCKRFKNASCQLQQFHHFPSVNLIFRSASSNVTFGSLLGNVTVYLNRRGAWQLKDISEIIKGAKKTGDLLITTEFGIGQKFQKYQDPVAPSNLPYILVYANDLAISEPNSVAITLQRYDPFSLSEETTHSPNASPEARVKRDTYIPDPIKNNELPEVEYSTFKKHDLWESAYMSLKPKTSKKERQRKGQENSEGLTKSQVLSFDEKTMKKARRRQRNEPRICSRRYLKVDFADIGWSEWIISPKSFDAYYCAGACEFPMPKVLRPSNHATIQSIVKAVGIIPGIPAPCCVPDKINSLSVLFLDENENVILKIYPNMSVETCACR
ncbi:growth/differentiation factor 10-like [Acipenser ruthenus]|uniref:growth/differentiation factor 10-like n=1 Tax=Acipenser ruthenus TaxID=7906 RepID=UPI00155FA63C|nr:growth/differentiation factor 10-like [Acipenser ruthenus]